MRYNYYIVAKKTFYWEQWEYIKGYWTYSAPFHPTDNSKVYVIGGYALGKKAEEKMLLDGDIIKISKKEVEKNLMSRIR